MLAIGVGLSLVVLPTPSSHAKRSRADNYESGLESDASVLLPRLALKVPPRPRKRATHVGLRVHLAQDSQLEPHRAQSRDYLFIYAEWRFGHRPDRDRQGAFAQGNDRLLHPVRAFHLLYDHVTDVLYVVVFS